MNPVVHFEMPYQDRERAAKFYQDTFGWKMQMLGPEMGNYVLAQTDETDEKGMLKETNRINGGMYEKSKDNQYPSVVIAVEDIKEHKKKVEEAGGKFLGGQGGEFDDIPGIGLYASFLDPEGNRVGMLQPRQSM
jgi:uncharacterized protein